MFLGYCALKLYIIYVIFSLSYCRTYGPLIQIDDAVDIVWFPDYMKGLLV
jgi:hypothetical protein